jgi:hypothetical protein
MSSILTVAVLVAIIVALTFLPDLMGKLRRRWPGLFEIDNPIPDKMPESWFLCFLACFIGVIIVGVEFGAPAAFGAFLLACVGLLIVIHVVPYVRHQYRRLCSK